MSVKVEPNEFYHNDGVWKPDEQQLKYIRRVLQSLPFNTTIYILISGVFGSQYALKPQNTLVLKPEHIKRKDVIIHEFGHHVWHKLLSPKQQWAWREVVDRVGRNVFKRSNNKDLYNENLAHTVEYGWGGSAKRVKDQEKAELLKNTLLDILKTNVKAAYEETIMKNLRSELKKRGYKQLAARIKACVIKAEEEKQQPSQPTTEDSTAKLQQAIIQLLKQSPNANDTEVHKLAEDMGVAPDVLENATYKLLADLVKGVGKHTDVPDDKYDAEQLKMGIEVEHEHTDNDGLAKEIAKDHLSEPGLENYYTLLLDMEKKAKERVGKSQKEQE